MIQAKEVFTLILFFSKSLSFNVKSVYEFQRFENFESNRETFEQELILIQALKNQQSNLVLFKEEAVKLMAENAFKSQDLPISGFKTLKKFHKMEALVNDLVLIKNHHHQFINNQTQNFPQEKDYIGAMKAIIQLEMTYGILKSQKMMPKSQHLLSMADLANLASLASNQQQFDIAMRFLQSIQELAKENQEEMKLNQEKFQQVSNNIVETHNELVRRKKQRVGYDFRGKIMSAVVCKQSYQMDFFQFFLILWMLKL